MTGQVKEQVLTRAGKLGIHVANGRLSLAPHRVRDDEWLAAPDTFDYLDLNNDRNTSTSPPTH
ncbi:MAG: hypothetical protein AAGI54_07125 [Planctomycetota bacterium]